MPPVSRTTILTLIVHGIELGAAFKHWENKQMNIGF